MIWTHFAPNTKLLRSWFQEQNLCPVSNALNEPDPFWTTFTGRHACTAWDACYSLHALIRIQGRLDGEHAACITEGGGLPVYMEALMQNLVRSVAVPEPHAQPLYGH